MHNSICIHKYAVYEAFIQQMPLAVIPDEVSYAPRLNFKFIQIFWIYSERNRDFIFDDLK